MTKLRKYIRSHFWLLAKKTKWTFLWRTWLEAVLLAYVVSSVAQAVFPIGPRADLARMTMWNLLALVVVIGPLAETIAFQCLPLELTTALAIKRSIRITLSVIPFALAHHFSGIPTVVAAGGIGGFYFAFTYERWRKESLAVGVLMTFLIHSSFNLVGVLGILLQRN